MSQASGGFSIIGFIGAVGAAVMSWMTNHSVGWAIIHAVCGWFYLLYRLCGCGHQ